MPWGRREDGGPSSRPMNMTLGAPPIENSNVHVPQNVTSRLTHGGGSGRGLGGHA